MSDQRFIILVRRDQSNITPDNLEFGELKFTDGDGKLHIGRADGSVLSIPIAALVNGLETTYPDSLTAELQARGVAVPTPNYAAIIPTFFDFFATTNLTQMALDRVPLFIEFNVVRSDSLSAWDAVNHQWVAPFDCLANVASIIRFDNESSTPSDGRLVIDVQLDSGSGFSEIARVEAGKSNYPSGETSPSIAVSKRLVAGDKLKIRVSQISGQDVPLHVDEGRSFLSITGWSLL